MSSGRFPRPAPPETLDEDPPLSEFMTRRLLGITPDADMEIAVSLLAEASVRHLPVMNGNRCLGLVFEHDVVRHIAGGWLRGEVPISKLCRPVPVLAPGDRRSVAATRMRDEGVDAVLVVTDSKLVGLVTATDVLRSLAGTGVSTGGPAH